MPELPEVETTCRGIEKHIEGHTIASVVVRQPSLRYRIPKNFAQQCETKKIQSVSRRAKYILLNFEKGGGLLIHLGMSGSLRVVKGKAREEIKKHDHVDFVFKKGQILRYHDPRRFGLILFADNVVEHDLLTKLGPEPLHENFNADYLHAQSRKRKLAVKPFIMDQKVVVGVGNIYAAEALFMSGISPKKPAAKISKQKYTELVKNIKIILKRAIEQGGTTLRDFVNSDGQPGYFKQQLFVYGRAGEACLKCDTTLKDITLGQRSTVYCPSCQK